MKIRRGTNMLGNIALPGDKSISHRAALIAAIAEGETRIGNYSPSADCASTLKCLLELGVEIEHNEGSVHVKGRGLGGLSRPANPLDCGNSGTTMRLLAGILSGHDFDSILTGDESLNKRPMLRVSEPLSRMGASISSVDGHAPLAIKGKKPLLPIDFTLPIASAQLKSAILLAGLNADGETAVTEPVPTRDHTERMLRSFGIDIRAEDRDEGRRISLDRGQPISPGDLKVPADISAAAFFIVGAACLPNSEITIRDLGVNPTRSAIITLLKSVGADIGIVNGREFSREPVASLKVRGGLPAIADGRPTLLNGLVIPNLIDEIPILAVLGTKLTSGLEVRDAAELRHKESDRISAVVKNLRSMGADVEEFPDGFLVKPSRLRGARLDAFGDHRIAMAFAIAGLLADGETEIIDAECADVSFPGFFETLQSVVRWNT